MAEKFKVGDHVQLTSGGPVMTVNAALSGSIYACVWFAGKKRDSGNFAEATLKPATVEEDK